jgi:hypothetical protein
MLSKLADGENLIWTRVGCLIVYHENPKLSKIEQREEIILGEQRQKFAASYQDAKRKICLSGKDVQACVDGGSK